MVGDRVLMPGWTCAGDISAVPVQKEEREGSLRRTPAHSPRSIDVGHRQGIHHLAKHREWYSSFKLFPFLPTPRPTPLDLRPFPQCKQHEVRDGCDKSAEDPDVEGLRKAAADATGAFAAATTQRGSGREPKKMSRTRAEAAEQEGGAAPQARTAAPRKPCERTRRKARQLR